MTISPMFRRLLLLAVLGFGAVAAGCSTGGYSLQDQDRTLSGGGSKPMPRMP